MICFFCRGSAYLFVPKPCSLGKASLHGLRKSVSDMVTQVRPASLPPAPVEIADRWWLLAAGGVFLLLLLVFYPGIYTSIDEASTFSMAYVLRHGTIFPGHTPAFHNAEFYPSLSPLGAQGRVYRFPPGFPLVLSAVSWIGWRAFFLVNPVLHLIAAGCFAGILRANRIPPRYAVLYLLFPGFVLFTRTLFSDAFAASLTTIALYLLLCRRLPFAAGLCLGLALLSRSTSLAVAVILLIAPLLSDWKGRGQIPVWKGQAARMLAGLLPFLAANWAYNFYAFGSPLQSAYSAQSLSWHGLAESGPRYALALLLIYPGLGLAPFVYRGAFWREGLAASLLITLVAASYNESTFGNSALQTLLSTPRQVLPVMPFFLLAFCGVLWERAGAARLALPKRAKQEALVAVGLVAVSGMIAFQHQQYLKSLQAIQKEVQSSLPPRSIVYANKDVYKLHQPVWDSGLCRELPDISASQSQADLQNGPVFVVLKARSRGFAGEDSVNAGVVRDMQSRFQLAGGPKSASGQVQYYRVLGLKTPRPSAEAD